MTSECKVCVFIATSGCCWIPEFSSSRGVCKRIHRSETGVNVLGKKDEGITQNDNNVSTVYVCGICIYTS